MNTRFYRSLIIITLLLGPLYNCSLIDNPINLLLINSGKDLTLKNETVSNVKSIAIDSAKITLKVGEEKLLLGIVTLKDNTNDYSNEEIEWSSSNPNALKISSSGKITAIIEGEVIVTAKYKNQDKNVRMIVKILPEDIKITPSTFISPTIIPTPIPTLTSKPIVSPTPIKPSPTSYIIPFSPIPTIFVTIPSSTSTPTSSPNEITEQENPIVPEPSLSPSPKLDVEDNEHI